MKFATQHNLFHAQAADAAKTAIIQAGFKGPDCEKAIGSGLNWVQMLMLVWQFIGTYGPQTMTIIADVSAAVALISTNPAGAVAAIQTLIAKDGPGIITLVDAIAAIFGVTIPTL